MSDQISKNTEKYTVDINFLNTHNQEKKRRSYLSELQLKIDQNTETENSLNFKYNDEFQFVTDFKKFTEFPLNKFNNNNIMTVLSNISKNENTIQPLQQQYLDPLIKFLDYFSNNFLKIGNAYHQKFKAHKESVKCVCFSNDDQYIISGGFDGTIKVHQLSNNELIQVFNNHSDKVLAVSFSHESYYLATGSKDKTVKIFDMKQMVEIQTLKGHNSKVNVVEFSKNDQILATGSEDFTIKLWQISTFNCIKTLIAHKDGVCSLNFSNDSKKLVSGSHDKYFRIWDVKSGECIIEQKGSQDGILDVKFSQDQKILAYTNIKAIHLISLERKLCFCILEGHDDAVRSLCFSLNGEKLCSASEDNTIRIWNMLTLQCEAILLGEQDSKYGFRSVKYSKCGYQILAGSFQGEVFIWKTNISDQQRTIQSREDEICCSQFSPSDNLIAYESDDNSIGLCNKNGQILGNLTGHEHAPTHLAFSPDETSLCSASEDKKLIIWNLKTQQIDKILVGHRHDVSSVGYSSCGKFIVSASFDKLIGIWDVQTGLLINYCKGHNDGVSSVCFDSQNKYILSGSYDHSVRLWDSSSCQQQLQFNGHTDYVNAVCFGLQDQVIFSASDDKTIRVWNIDEYQCKAILKGHESRVSCLAFSQIKNILCSGGDDKTVRCWSIDNMNCITIIFDYIGPVLSLNFSNNGKSLISGDEDGNLILTKTDNLNNYTKLMTFIRALQKQENSDFKYQKIKQLEPFLKKVSPQIIKTQLPLGFSIFHYALYQNDNYLLEESIKFAIDHELYIQPSLDIFNQSPFHLAQGNKIALTLLVSYYSDKKISVDANLNQGSNIFVEFIPMLLREKIHGIENFLERRIFNAQGDQPKVCEYFQNTESQSFDQVIPSKLQYSKMLSYSQIKNKSAVKFRIFDMPDILNIDNKFMAELIKQPSNSTIFESEFIIQILTYKWKHYGYNYFLKDLIIYFLFLSLFTFNAVILIPSKMRDHDDQQDNYLSKILNLLQLLFLMRYLFIFYEKLKFNEKKTFQNLYDLITYVLIAICIVVDFKTQVKGDNPTLRYLLSSTLYFLWFKFIQGFKGFKKMGFFLRIISSAISEMKLYFLIVLITLVQFTVSGYLLQNFSTNKKIQNLEDMFRIMFIDLNFDVDNIFKSPDINNKNYIYIQFFFMVSTFVLTIVLINLLISFIIDIYDKVQNQERIAVNYERAIIIYEFEKKISKKQKLQLDKKGIFKKFLIIANCKNEEEFNNQNENMRNKIFRIEKNLNDKQHFLQKIDDLYLRLNKIEQFQEKIERLESLGNKNNMSANLHENQLNINKETVDYFNSKQDQVQQIYLQHLEMQNELNNLIQKQIDKKQI